MDISEFAVSEHVDGPVRVREEWLAEHGSLEGLNSALGVSLLDRILDAEHSTNIGELIYRHANCVEPDETVVCPYEDPDLRPFAIVYTAMFAEWRRRQVVLLVEAGSDWEAAEVEVALGGGKPLPERLRYEWKWLYGEEWGRPGNT